LGRSTDDFSGARSYSSGAPEQIRRLRVIIRCGVEVNRSLFDMGDLPTVIAMAGGGCTNGRDAKLDEFVVGKCPLPRPQIGFIGAASCDDAGKISGFHVGFERHD
jgi:hypothetical protein